MKLENKKHVKNRCEEDNHRGEKLFIPCSLINSVDILLDVIFLKCCDGVLVLDGYRQFFGVVFCVCFVYVNHK
jgi:hypothetical protein